MTIIIQIGDSTATLDNFGVWVSDSDNIEKECNNLMGLSLPDGYYPDYLRAKAEEIAEILDGKVLDVDEIKTDPERVY